MSTPQTTEPRPRRRWLRLSLRGALLIVLALAVCLGTWVTGSRNQEAAVAAVSAPPYSANITYDDDPNYWPEETSLGRRLWRLIRKHTPGWLESRLGRDYFDSALAIAFSRDQPGDPTSDREVMQMLGRVGSLDQLSANIEVVDADIASIARLTNLKRLSFRAASPRLTDASLGVLAGLPSFEALEVHDAPITDAGLARLKDARRLKSLLLGEAKPFGKTTPMIAIRGEGLVRLSSLGSLEDLELHSPALTGDGLRHLGSLTGLKRLRLKCPAITDDDLRHLASLRNLESLELVGTTLDGTGFRHLTGLSAVSYVCLEGPKITDAAVPYLARLPALESVMIYGTQVTASGLEAFRATPRLRQMGLVPAATGDTRRLKQALPNCNVINGGKSL